MITRRTEFGRDSLEADGTFLPERLQSPETGMIAEKLARRGP